MGKILAKGAEAVIVDNKHTVIKKRIPKTYRITQLDTKLRRERTRKEVRLLKKAAEIISVPKVISFDEIKSEIQLEKITGKKLSLHLDTLKNKKQIATVIGKQIAQLHEAGIIHGDLTTSNMILSKKKIYFIDFGLGFHSNNVEDKAVDLHLIKQALEAKHYKNYQSCFSALLKGYRTSPQATTVLNRLEKVEARGRYKQSY